MDSNMHQNTLAFYSEAFVLVEQWTTDSLLGVLMAVFTACALGSLYEWLSRLLYNWDKTSRNISPNKKCSSLTLRFLRSVLHSLSVTVSYLLMLLLMTYNIWVIISILIGSAAGYFFLGPKIDFGRQERKKKPGASHEKSLVPPSRADSIIETHSETRILSRKGPPLAKLPAKLGSLDEGDEIRHFAKYKLPKTAKDNARQGKEYGEEDVEERQDLLVK